MQGEERYGKIAATSAKTAETFRATDGTFAKTGRISGKTIGISGKMFNQERARDRLHKIGGIFTKTGRISEKIIEISDTIAKTGVGIGKAYGTTWLAVKDTVVKHSLGQGKPATTDVVAGFVSSRNRNTQVFRLRTLPLKAFSLSTYTSVTFALRQARSHRPR